MVSHGESKAHVPTLVDVRPKGPELDSDERLFQDLMERFSVLAETCSRFSREVYRRTRSPPEEDVDGAIRATLKLTRTVFDPWSLEVLAATYLKKTVGIRELREAIGRGSDETLGVHVGKLVLLGLLQPEVAGEPPSRARYSLTHKGLMIARLGEPLLLYLRLAHGWSKQAWDDPSLGGTSDGGGFDIGDFASRP